MLKLFAKVRLLHFFEQVDPFSMYGRKVCYGKFNGCIGVSQNRPCYLIIRFNEGFFFGECPLKTGIRMVVAICYMVYELATLVLIELEQLLMGFYKAQRASLVAQCSHGLHHWSAIYAPLLAGFALSGIRPVR